MLGFFLNIKLYILVDILRILQGVKEKVQKSLRMSK